MKLKYIALAALTVFVVSGYAKADNPTATNSEKPGMTAGNTETLTATITNINKKTREITLTGSEGNVMTFVAGPEVKNFDMLKKGDQVTAQYEQALAVNVHKSDQPLSHEEKLALETAKKGATPGMRATRTTKVTAEVVSVDYTTRMMTLRGPRGNTMAFKVGEEVKRLNEIKTGDKVEAHYSEALAINVTPKAKK